MRFPWIANAGKYALAEVIVLFGVFNTNFQLTNHWFVDIWVAAYMVSSLYAFTWDVKMNWGLGCKSEHHPYLRDRLMLHKPRYYVLAIILDFFLRFAWAMTFLPPSGGFFAGAFFQNVLGPTLAALEILRRTMWMWFRLENEHLHNTEGYRQMDFIPLHFDPPVSKAPTRAYEGLTIILEVMFYVAVIVCVGVVAIVVDLPAPIPPPPAPPPSFPPSAPPSTQVG
jgi:hypothetical protein